MEEFNSDWFEGAELPSIKIQKGELVRIETQSNEYCKILFDKFSNLEFDKIIVGDKSRRRFSFFSSTVKKYLTRNSVLDETEIEEYCRRINILPDSLLSEMTDGQNSTIDLISLIRTSKLLLLNSSGMYLSCLQVTNEIVKGALENGGSCIEVTYPPYGVEFLDGALHSKVISFQREPL